MYVEDGVLVVSATDLVGYTGCEHKVVLDRQVAWGKLAAPVGARGEELEEADVARARGMEHEHGYLGALRAQGLTVVDLADADHHGVASLQTAAEEVGKALAAAEVDVLYQATFFDDTNPAVWWRGHADFLTRVPSATGPSGWTYEPEDTKLARRVKPSAVLQLCNYAEQLERLQGAAPEWIHVVLGNRERVSLRLREVAAYYRAAKARFAAFLADGAPERAYPVPVEACALCRWKEHCEQCRLADDHLSGVAQLRGEQAHRLEAAGITTIAALAKLYHPLHRAADRDAAGAGVAGIGGKSGADTGAEPAAKRITDLRMNPATLAKLSRQAALQVQGREHPNEPPPYEFQPVEADRGLCLLPEPSPGDVFFDIEGDPYASADGLEYLFGYTLLPIEPGERFGLFTALWAHTPAEERVMFEQFIDFVVARRAGDPGMHVYHYAPYEPSRIKTLMGRYGTREAEVDDLLRGDVFVDLYRVVRQGLVLGLASYSIKKLEVYYLAPREDGITDAASSIVEYERWLEQGDPAILEAIAAYNQVDCESTLALRAWLEERRSELEGRLGQPVPRPTERPVDAAGYGEAGDEAAVAQDASQRNESEPDAALGGAPDGQATSLSSSVVAGATAIASAAEPAPGVEELMDELLAGVDDPPGPSAGTAQQGRWLLAQLLAWHRREAKPGWWRWFDQVLFCGHEELYDAADAVAGLTYEGVVDVVRQSLLHRYSFDPAQECKLRVGEPVEDPATEAAHYFHDSPLHAVGSLEGFDAKAGTLDLLRGKRSLAPHPSALIAGRPLRTKEQEAALQRLARAVLVAGIDAPGPLRAGRDLLLRLPPRLLAPHRTGTDTAAALVQSNETAADAVVRLGQQLDGGCLAVQGPPGSGKTRTAARLVVELLAAKKQVGVTANSHAVIGNLLGAVLDEAERQGVEVNALQRAPKRKALDHPGIAPVESKEAAIVLASGMFNLIGGTSFLFAREDMVASLDHLVVDEAGQLSLANTLAVSGAARNLVLFGDPQQLPQPVQGTHPPGAANSALEHYLGGAATMSPHLGVFLDRSWRMHPAVCASVSELSYEERLSPVDGEGLDRQAVGHGVLVAGSGVRWLPVEHTGNRQSSPEEAELVGRLVRELLGRPFTDRFGRVRPLEAADLLVVAPYNAQVHEIATQVPAGVQVGTVDRFQGREAPVVLVSLAASSAADIPRGMEFLYNHNRLNVAVSRAQALAVVVGSPTLLAAPCHTVEQMKLVNGLCRFVEYAEAQAPPLAA